MEEKFLKKLNGYDGSEYSDLMIEDLRKAGLPDEAEAVVLTVGEAWNLPTDFECDTDDSEKFVLPTSRLIKEHLAEVTEKSQELAEYAVSHVREIFPGWRVSAEAVCGKAAGELVKKADEWSPDLLVGLQGRSTIGRVFLGSVSSKVAAKAKCTVEIVREAD